MTVQERDSVLELTQSRAAIISCLDDEATLCAMPACGDAFIVRIASDEAWVIGPASRAPVVAAHARRHCDQPGSYGVITDVTDAWSVLSVRGVGVMSVWERLSENAPPLTRPGFSQGAIASVQAKAILFDDRILFVTPAPQGHHLVHRILHGCADLEPQMTEARELALEVGEAGVVLP